MALVRCLVVDPDAARAARLAEVLNQRPGLTVVEAINGLERLATLCGVPDLDIFIIDWELVSALPLVEARALFRTTGSHRSLLLVPADHIAAIAELETLGVTYMGRPAGKEDLAPLAEQLSMNIRALQAIRVVDTQHRQTQKMEALGRLAAGVAHDFNNELNAIFTFGAAALGELSPAHPQRKPVEEMVKAARRAAGLTRQLQVFSRQQELRPRLTDLNAEVVTSAAMLEALIGARIRLVLKPAADLGVVSADPGQIVQVVTNLAVNARDAMPEGGQITISTANVQSLPNAERPSPLGWVLLSVQDEGTGMDEETQSHIFEPFYTTKGLQAGTGLGLSTVYGIVQQSGGRILVRSAIGKGTTFDVYLPRTAGERPAASAAARVDLGGQESVLIIEEERVIRMAAAHTLNRNGYRVLEAENVGRARQILDSLEGPPQVVIIPPTANGVSLVSHLRNSRATTKIIYLLGPQDSANAEAAASAVLAQPFTPQELLERVRGVLDSKELV